MCTRTVNHCDHNHVTADEVRLLPTGGDGNMLVCYAHYLQEMVFRKEMIRTGYWAPAVAEFPVWESLKVYEG